jgi:hypothetical protein
MAMDLFGEVAKLAAMQELKIRLLANKTKAIEDSAYEHKVAETSNRIVEHFTSTGHLTESDVKLLIKSQGIRNKILHCEFNEAVKRIESLLGTPAPGKSVQVLKFDPKIGGLDLLSKLFATQKAIAEGTQGEHQDASKMSDRDLGIFGGLINAAHRRALHMAIEIFTQSNALLDRLMDIETTVEAEGSSAEES